MNSKVIALIKVLFICSILALVGPIYVYGKQDSTPMTDFEYREIDSGIEITRYKSNQKEVFVPKTINGKSVKSIGDEAFMYCNKVTSITIPEGVEKISPGAFLCCAKLRSITIPESVTTIGEWAFGYCPCLTFITIPASVINFTPNFNGYPAYGYTRGAFTDIPLLTLEFAEGTTKIPDNACRYAEGLVSVRIPEGVVSIGKESFRACPILMSLTIPDSVISIGNYAFAGCSGITKLTIPHNVANIGEGAFEDWTSSQTIYIEKGTDTSRWNSFWKDSCDAKIVYM